jgi:hypothetical protein
VEPSRRGHNMVAVNGVKAAKKKGFRIPDKVAVITFEGTDYDGAEIRAKLNVNFKYFSEIQAAISEDSTNGLRVAELFGDHALIDWNLEDYEGDPVPANAEGMTMIPVELVNLMVGHWAEAVSDIPDPLEKISSDISTLAQLSTAMESPSASPGS